jgi:hypothetical protein
MSRCTTSALTDKNLRILILEHVIIYIDKYQQEIPEGTKRPTFFVVFNKTLSRI